jgi:translation initiation factor 2B subunit (eIF-2B alpha/beta/delta family)
MDPEAWGGVHEAASDRRSGASEIVRRAAEALAALPPNDVEEAVLTLIRGQPSMAPLWRLCSETLGSTDHVAAARSFAIRVAAERDGIAKNAAALLPDLVLVHSFSSTVIAAVATAGARAICTFSEPGGEGAHMAERLTEVGVDARVVDDAVALLAVDEVGGVVVGADAVGPAGVVNKVGTRTLAEEARRHSTPCYSLAGESKLLAVDLPAPRPFERTPMDLFTSVITEEGSLSPDEVARRVNEHPVHPLLAELLEKHN